MYKVKVSIETEIPIKWQTPGVKGIWGNCEFHVNIPLEECDYWVVIDSLGKVERTICPKENLLLITGEPPTVKCYAENFLKQFSLILTCHPRIQKHHQAMVMHQLLPWMAGYKFDRNKKKWDTEHCLGYDFFSTDFNLYKMDKMAIITSNKTITRGHRRRLDFIARLEKEFPGKFDVYGNGFKEAADKYEVLSKYKYALVIENSVFHNYWTEKVADAYLSNAFPVYYGCPNIGEYFPQDAMEVIDIEDYEGSVAKIKELFASNRFEASLASIREAKELVLKKYNMFAVLADIVESHIKEQKSEACVQELHPMKVDWACRFRYYGSKLLGK